MNYIFDILIVWSPLLLISFGALISEYAGMIAVFTDGIINLSAFFCFLFLSLTNNIFVSISLSFLLCIFFVLLIAEFTERTQSNPFLTALAINLFSSGFISLLSVQFFKTKGVLSFQEFIPLFVSNEKFLRTFCGLPVSCIFLSLVVILWIALYKTKWGIVLTISGKHSQFLDEKGISSKTYHLLSWMLAGSFAILYGITFMFRLSSFVPNISSGRGWIALAVVFLGKTNPKGVFAGSLIFTLLEYGIMRLQNISLFQGLSPTIFISIPYLVALVIIILTSTKKNGFVIEHH